ncbi:MAG: hypothetical protein NT154_39125 [Verrucomicrobia bacterium]|nr:hypothetical protein [Verrucomicrobiota bacterium]
MNKPAKQLHLWLAVAIAHMRALRGHHAQHAAEEDLKAQLTS